MPFTSFWLIPFISDLSLNLAVLLRGSDDNGGLQFARVKIPQNVPRFVPLPDGTRMFPLEQLVGWHLDRLFGGQDVVDYYEFRVTRADLAVEEEEADDLLEAMETVLRFRQRAAQAVRLEVELDARVVLEELSGVGSPRGCGLPRGTPLGARGLCGGSPASTVPTSRTSPVPRSRSRGWRAAAAGKSTSCASIYHGDVLIHHPYESFATSTGAFLAQAAADPHVLAIKQTLYRTSVPDDPALGGEEAIVDR